MFQNKIEKLKMLLFVTRLFHIRTQEIPSLIFPSDFSIGIGTSAYQIEGAWNVSDKGESIWDRFVHENPYKIVNQSTGDVACDSFHKYKEDIKRIKEMGLDHYRFSISWSRILPTGYSNVVSKDGLRYYHELLNELEKNQIVPYVTIYHWDHPEVLQKMGGWTNDIMVDLFGDYARLIFREFGPRVKIFTTINEPYAACLDGYTTGKHAPGYTLGKAAEYLCGHNMLKAHARAYHIYNDEFRSKQGGKIGIALPCQYYFAKSENDTDARERAFQFTCGRFMHPIFSKEGDYPVIVKQKIYEKSISEGRSRSKLPTFDEKWIKYIKGTSDYFGLNHYTSYIVESVPIQHKNDEENDADVIYSFDPTWASTGSSWLKVVPIGLRNVLIQIKQKYNNPPVYILENGVSDNEMTLNDVLRINYLHSYMREMLIAREHYGCNVKAYTIWSLLDNFEWDRGYSEFFGVVNINFNDNDKIRKSKLSAKWIKNITESRKIPLYSLTPFSLK